MTATTHDDITQQAQAIVQHAGSLPVVQDELYGLFVQIAEQAPAASELLNAAWGRVTQIVEFANRQTALIQALTRAAAEFRAQREAALAKHDALVQDLSNPWLSALRNPVIAELLETVTESHNAAFWESLPYDMADTLGEGWQFWDADHLFSAITADLEEVDDEGAYYGFTHDELVAFRAALLTAIRKLMGEGGDE